MEQKFDYMQKGNKRTTVVLPITNEVPFKAYQIRGFESAILLANNRNYENLFYNTCINYYIRKKTDDKYLFDYTCNNTMWFSEHDVFLRQTVPFDKSDFKEDTLIETVTDALNKGLYVTGYFNERYIPNKYNYGLKDFRHGYLIYGYNSNEETLYGLGYTDNSKFDYYKINYTDYSKAVINMENPSVQFRYLNPNYKPEVCPKNIFNELSDYLHSEYTVNNSTGKHCNDFYGVAANNIFCKEIPEYSSKGYPLDIRHSSFFYENKKFMLKRLNWLHNNGIIRDYTEAYYANIQDSEIVHNLFIKYNITGSLSIIDSIINILNRINRSDEDILLDVYLDLDKYLKNKRNEEYM